MQSAPDHTARSPHSKVCFRPALGVLLRTGTRRGASSFALCTRRAHSLTSPLHLRCLQFFNTTIVSCVYVRCYNRHAVFSWSLRFSIRAYRRTGSVFPAREKSTLFVINWDADRLFCIPEDSKSVVSFLWKQSIITSRTPLVWTIIQLLFRISVIVRGESECREPSSQTRYFYHSSPLFLVSVLCEFLFLPSARSEPSGSPVLYNRSLACDHRLA